MKKGLKITLIVLGVLVGIVALDTLQAKLFNNSPVIHIRKYYENSGSIDYIDKGIFVNHYKYTYGGCRTLFSWDNTAYWN